MWSNPDSFIYEFILSFIVHLCFIMYSKMLTTFTVSWIWDNALTVYFSTVI